MRTRLRQMTEEEGGARDKLEMARGKYICCIYRVESLSVFEIFSHWYPSSPTLPCIFELPKKGEIAFRLYTPDIYTPRISRLTPSFL